MSTVLGDKIWGPEDLLCREGNPKPSHRRYGSSQRNGVGNRPDSPIHRKET